MYDSFIKRTRQTPYGLHAAVEGEGRGEGDWKEKHGKKRKKGKEKKRKRGIRGINCIN